MVKDIALRIQPVLIEAGTSDAVHHKPRTIVKTFLIEATFYPAMLIRVNCGGDLENLRQPGETRSHGTLHRVETSLGTNWVLG